jgi:hypothetical protein
MRVSRGARCFLTAHLVSKTARRKRWFTAFYPWSPMGGNGRSQKTMPKKGKFPVPTRAEVFRNLEKVGEKPHEERRR